MNISVELTAIISGAIFFVFWLAGISFATAQNKKDISTLWTKHDALDKRMIDELSSISKSLARIEGRLSVGNESSSN